MQWLFYILCTLYKLYLGNIFHNNNKIILYIPYYICIKLPYPIGKFGLEVGSPNIRLTI